MWWHQGSHKAIKSTIGGEKKRRRRIRGERVKGKEDSFGSIIGGVKRKMLEET